MTPFSLQKKQATPLVISTLNVIITSTLIISGFISLLLQAVAYLQRARYIQFPLLHAPVTEGYLFN
ncbi:hypothetical protein CW304_18180 [Bacillus sp. UFRGS-B20]|nr:hypothetical protein CW304_18180 [Bacillus sp. UFRGS-B20]